MRPESTDANPRPLLTDIAEEYFVERARAKFIGLRAAPLFESAKRIAQYFVFKRESFKKRVTKQKRAAGGAYNRIVGEFGVKNYSCEDAGLEYPVDDVLREQYKDQFDADAAATDILVTQVLMEHEARVAALYVAASLTNHNVTTAWSTTSSAVPVQDIQSGLNTLNDANGSMASDVSLIIPRADFQELQRVQQIINLVQYIWSAGTMIPVNIPAATVAQALGIKEILVAESNYDSAEEGATESNTQFWSAGVMYLAVLAPSGSSLRIPSQARTILWTDDSPQIPTIESYREEQTRSDIIRARFHAVEVNTGDDDIMAYQLTNT